MEYPEDQVQRIIEVVRREEGADCPELEVLDIEEAIGPAIVTYRCKESEDPKQLRLTERDARYIGLDRSLYRADPEFGL